MNVHNLSEYNHNLVGWIPMWEVTHVDNGAIYTLPCRLNMHDDAITLVLRGIYIAKYITPSKNYK